MRRTTAATLVALLASFDPASVHARDRLTDQPRGAIEGHLIDLDGGVLPGATVVARGPAMARSVVADGGGRFQLSDLEPGTYRVQAELSGFRTTTAERVVVVQGRPTECNFVLKFGDRTVVTHSALDAQSWREVLGYADLVARFRVTRVIGPGAPGERGQRLTTDYEATASSVVKGPGVRAGQTFRFTQVQAGAWGMNGVRLGGEDSLYRTGDEFVGFFRRDASGRWVELEADAFMFPIVKETISWRRAPDLGVENGMTVNAFLALIRR